MSNLGWLPDQVRRLSKVRTLEAGEVLFRQGDRANAIFEVEQGRMRLIRHTIDNRPVTLHTARAGELFAEAALFADRYHCDAVAASAARVLVHPKRALLAAFRGDPALSERFMAASGTPNSCASQSARGAQYPLGARTRVKSSRPRGRRRQPDGDAGRHLDGSGGRNRPQPRSALPHARGAGGGRHHHENPLDHYPENEIDAYDPNHMSGRLCTIA